MATKGTLSPIADEHHTVILWNRAGNYRREYPFDHDRAAAEMFALGAVQLLREGKGEHEQVTLESRTSKTWEFRL